MLIWKTNSFDIKIASVRYRCLLPSRYLESHGYKSCFYAGNNPIDFGEKSNSDVLIFVKSFTPYDLFLAKKAQEADIPVILDICDNIFIDEYISKFKFKPSEIFKEMSEVASAIVTTGIALKNTIKTEVNPSVPIFIVPDANETVKDINYALFICKWGRWLKLFSYRPISIIYIIAKSLPKRIKVIQKYYQKNKNKNTFNIKENYHRLQEILNKYNKNVNQLSNKLINLVHFHKYFDYAKKTKNILINNELATNTSFALQKSVESNRRNAIVDQINLQENFVDIPAFPRTVENECKTDTFVHQYVEKGSGLKLE